jgi:hypothetical protein
MSLLKWGWIPALLLLGGCGTLRSYDSQNYEACLPALEEDSQTRGTAYSYTPQNFDECRAPARYRD